MNRRILLSGVHGVGKGYFLEHSINKNSITVYSASDIIAKYHKTDNGYKRVEDVDLNQNILLQDMRYLFKKQERTIILDGHLVILSEKDSLERIPFKFFEDGMFNTLFLMQDEPKKIYERLYERDGFYKLDISTIEKIQKEELKYAIELEEVGVDVVHLTPNTSTDLLSQYLI